VETPLIVGISGGSGSGKTTFVRMLQEQYGCESLLVVKIDNYYRDLSHIIPEERMHANFDHPDSLDLDLLFEHLSDLKNGKTVECPTYDFATHTRTDQKLTLSPCKAIAVDGILSLHDKRMRNLYDLSVFVDVADDLRFIRRLNRDITERGRTIESVMEQFLDSVKPMHDKYVDPQRFKADIIVNWTKKNLKAVKILAAAMRA